jgi:thiamine biosynthesis lipoprotein
MGFPVSLRVDDEDVPEEAADAVFAWLREADERFSPFRPGSEVSRLDRGELSDDDLGADLREILGLCAHYRAATGGAFDVRLPGRGLDPCAVVKGWSVHRAAELLRAAGAQRFVLNAGGDVVASGGPWRVGVRHPEHAGQLCTVLELTDDAVVTSARYRTLGQCSTLQGGGAGRPAHSGPEGRSGMAESPCRATELSGLPPDGREVRPAEAT